MKPLLTGKEMKRCDEITIHDFGVPSCVLMERAALVVVETLEKEHLLRGSIGIFCGVGNNGGDGLAIARLLYLKGHDVRFFICGDRKRFSEECGRQYEICTKYGVPEAAFAGELFTSDVVLDCLFGIGLSRDLTGEYAALVESINECGAYKVAVDMPSGISADDGSVLGVACRCDLTITFAFPKAGQYLMPGAAYCGRILVAQMGITKESLSEEKPRFYVMEPSDLKLLPTPAMDAHKGSVGKVLVIAGGPQMTGAAFLAARAAFQMGAGMVKVYTPACNHTVLQSLIPEAIVIGYGNEFSEAELLELLSWADVILMGPGMGTGAAAAGIVSYVMEHAAVPMVCDADCLNLFALQPQLLRSPHAELIFTPHVGEMARLTGESILYIKDHMIQVASEFSREYQVTCVLKDARSIVCVPYEKTYINTFGNPGMATAGSGDVLSGIIAGCLSQKVPLHQAAALGVMIHAMAGDLAAEERGTRSLMAGDIVDQIYRVLKRRDR